MGSMNANPSSAGKIWLVGAGPGDPDLLTLRAARLLMQAELIVHDGLVDPRILAMAPGSARLVSVAKRRSRHSMPQEDINALLVTEALAGRQVLRLKGGDPFIFGRGGEEAQMPLTHRNAASVVSFVSGQCKGLTDQNWAGLAGHGRTLVIYMGLATAPDIAEKLIADGLEPGTPLAVVENASRPEMRVLRGVLAGLADLVAHEGVQSPAIIVIGAVTARSEQDLRVVALEAAL